MQSVENLISDNEGNHLVVVLSFYDDNEKAKTFRIPLEFHGVDIVDISIRKLDLDKPLTNKAFFEMCHWLIEQFNKYPDAIFSFICSFEPLTTNHLNMTPGQYRWNLFDFFYQRNMERLRMMGVDAMDFIVGPEGYQTFAKVFYRMTHAPIIHIVVDHLNSKYS